MTTTPNSVVIRTSGNAMDISPDGRSALPENIGDILENQLRYDYKKLLRGRDAYDWQGKRRPIRIERRVLYDYDKYGRLVCSVGLLPRVQNLLTNAGYTITIENLDPPHARRDRYEENWDNVIQNFNFKARQESILVKIATNPRGVIDAATGFGKTFMFEAICLLYPKANILIVAKRRDIVDSIRLRLSKVIPNVGMIGSRRFDHCRVTIVTADSLHKINPSDWDIVIGDEVHELAADSYAKELARFRFSRMYGFTATPTGRMDNADMRIESLFGPVIYTVTYQEAVELGIVVPIVVRWLDVNIDNPAEGKVDTVRQRWGIWRNQDRNQIIANAAREYPDEQVLIMVTTLEHAAYLKSLLPEFTMCYAERSDGDDDFLRFKRNNLIPEDTPIMTTARRQQCRLDFETGTLKKVIATDVWSTGVNFSGLGVLIRADARGSDIMDTQIPGRVCRQSTDGEKKHGILIDCMDQFDSGFYSSARKRRKNYVSKGWIQEMALNQNLTPTQE